MSPPVHDFNALSLILTPLAQAAGADGGGSTLDVGPYIGWWKLLLLFIGIVSFLRTMQFVDKDATPARLPREPINIGLWVLLVVTLALIIFLPNFWMALGATVVLLAGGIIGYLVWRNSTVGLKDLPDQFKAYVKDLLSPKKKDKVKEKEKEEAIAAGNVTLTSKSGKKLSVSDDDEAGKLGMNTAHQMLADPLEKESERIAIVQISPRPATAEAPAQERFGTKMTVDGVDHAGLAYEAEAAIHAIAYLKELGGLDTSETRKVQVGQFKARTSKGSHSIQLTTRGTRTGETAVLEVDVENRYKLRASQLGLSTPQKEQLEAFRDSDGGLVLAAAPEGGGLDALEYGLLHEHDAFTRHIVTAERSPRLELEGIQQTTVGENPNEHAKQYSWLADQRPDVFLADRPAGNQAAKEVLRVVEEPGPVAYVGLRADDAAAAINTWIKQIGDAKAALAKLQLVVAGRIMRKLCDACKVPYEPSDNALAKLGISKGKVSELYKARTEPMMDQRGNPVTCPFCGGLGYKGRTAAFEVMPVNSDVRKQLLKDPSPSVVRNLLRAANLRTLNEAAIRHVIAGRTDLGEVQRVLGGGSSSSKARPSK